MLLASRDDGARGHHCPTDRNVSDESADSPRIGGLDGLRAVAVIAVVVYHLWPDRVPAGFLGVDLFMVLSGYLITGLLVDERAHAGIIHLGRFWVRRFRRLVPALLGLLAGVAVWVDLTGTAELKRTVRGQGIASLLYAGNWKLVADGTSYASLSSMPSPLLHLWSLAIEEQFYLVWPLVVLGALVLTRGRRTPLMIAAAAGAVASATWMAVLFDPHEDPLRLYYGTDTRAQAFLVGAVAVLAARRFTSERARRVVRVVSGPAFVALVAAFVLLDAPGVLYHGGFGAFAVVSAFVTIAVTQPGPVTRALDRRPLRLIGRVSYGIYLWHWPIIVLVTERSAPVRGVGLLVLRVALIAMATTASWLLIEHPYQRARGDHALRLAPIGITLAAMALLLLPTTQVAAYASYDVSHIAAPEVGATPSTFASTTTSPPGEPSAPAVLPKTVMLIGDSGTYDMAPAFVAGFARAGIRVVSTAYPGIGLTRPDGVQDVWTGAIERYHPDFFIVGLGTWDNAFVTSAGIDAYRARVDDVISLLAADGAHILWLSVLPSDSPLPNDGPRPDIQEGIFSQLPMHHPGVVDFLNLTPALSTPQGGTPRAIDGHLLRKPDGWHLCPDGAAAITHEVLAHLGLDSDGWDQGTWRRDHRYDDPPGGCPGF